MSVNRNRTTQLRLLLPQEMLEELTSIATSRQVSRLALIRRFLRLAIDDELAQIETYFEQIERRRKTHEKLQEHLTEMEW